MPAKVLGSRDGRRSRNVPILPILSITVATLFLVSCSGGEAAGDTNQDDYTIPAAQAISSVAGTYRIAICKTTPCSTGDSSNSIAWGLVVLDTIPIAEQRSAQLGAHYLSGPPNGCIALTRLQDNAKSYAGIVRGGATHWIVSGGELRFTLFRSPDAGYEVRLGHTSNGFEGDGTSFGGGYYGATSSDETPPDYTRDVVAAVRIGAPDLSLCRNDPNPV